MRVIRGRSSNPFQPLTSPFPVPGNKWWQQYLFWEFRGGDVIQPLGSGDWFKPPFFLKVSRTYAPQPTRLFVSWRVPLLNWQGYAGAKAFGVDHSEYARWMCSEKDIYEGSVAIMDLSIRPFASIK